MLAVVVVVASTACGGDPATSASAGSGGSGATETLSPQLMVAHGPNTQEWETTVVLDENSRAELVEQFAAVVADFEAADAAGDWVGDPLATDPAELEAIDLDENFLVTGGYYCLSGDPRLVVEPDQLVLHLDSALACDAPQPVSSIFVVPRSLTSGTFTLETVEAGAGDRHTAIVVEDWVIAEHAGNDG